MNTWKIALREGAVAGTVATLLSTALLAAIGRRENRSAAAPVNAVSHWLWGDESLHADGAEYFWKAWQCHTRRAAAVAREAISSGVTFWSVAV